MSYNNISTTYVCNLVDTPDAQTLRIRPRQVIEVSRVSGEIISINELSKGIPCNAVWLPEYSFLIPTFVDTHVHAPQFKFIGSGQGLPLMRWLDELTFKVEAGLDADPRKAERVYRRLCERMIENGTGTALCFGTIGEEANMILARCFKESGLRGYIGKVSMHEASPDYYREKDAADSVNRARSFIESLITYADENTSEGRLPLLYPVVTPRFIPTCSDECLQGLAALAAQYSARVLIQSHMCESADEVAFVKATRDGREDEEIFDSCKLLTTRTVMAHCTGLTPKYRQLMCVRGAGVASCPLSNAFFSDRPFALRECIDTPGLQLGLGTDIAAGYTVSMQDALRTAVVAAAIRSQLHAISCPPQAARNLSISWIESLYLATRGGALMLHVGSADFTQDRSHALGGLFAPGAPFDAQLIAPVNPTRGEGWSQGGGVDMFCDETPLEARDTIGPWQGRWKWSLDDAVERWAQSGAVGDRVGIWVQGNWLGAGKKPEVMIE